MDVPGPPYQRKFNTFYASWQGTLVLYQYTRTHADKLQTPLHNQLAQDAGLCDSNTSSQVARTVFARIEDRSALAKALLPDPELQVRY